MHLCTYATYSQGIPRYCILISSSMFESLVPLLYRVSTRLRMSPRGFLRLSAGTSSNDALESSEGSAQKLRQLLTASLCRVPLSRYSEVRDVGLIWTLRELCGEFVRLLSPLNRVVDSRKQFYNVLYIYIYIYVYIYIHVRVLHPLILRYCFSLAPWNAGSSTPDTA